MPNVALKWERASGFEFSIQGAGLLSRLLGLKGYAGIPKVLYFRKLYNRMARVCGFWLDLSCADLGCRSPCRVGSAGIC